MVPPPAASQEIPAVPLPIPVMRLYAGLQTAYCLLLALALILNGILRAYEPHDTIIVGESARFADEIITLAHKLSERRPLGASYIPVCLTPVWATTDDPLKQAEVEKMLAEYQTDFAQAKWIDIAIWTKGMLNRLHLKVAVAKQQPL